MLELVVPAPTAARLQRLAHAPTTPHTLRSALTEQVHPLLDSTSAAAPRDAPATGAARVSRAVLTEVAAWARAEGDAALTLDALLHGAEVYVAPRPRYERPKELDESLARIARMHEEADYARMTQRAEPYTLRGVAAGMPATSEAREQLAWRESREQLSVILNVALSVGAVATASWWAAGHASPIWVRRALTQKVSVSLGLALLVGVAEVVLYSRYWRAMHARRERLAQRAQAMHRQQADGRLHPRRPRGALRESGRQSPPRPPPS